MTSMPASRSARAMIFAPRSWPSRPGLATTTRILPAADWASAIRDLAVLAPASGAGARARRALAAGRARLSAQRAGAARLRVAVVVGAAERPPAVGPAVGDGPRARGKSAFTHHASERGKRG